MKTLSKSNLVVIETATLSPKGNYTVKNDEGNQFHVAKTTMESAGFNKIEDIKFPLYALMVEQTITPWVDGKPQIDSDGNELTVIRPTITKIYKSREEYVQRQVDKQSVNIEIAVGIKTAGIKSGLNEETVNSLLAAI